MKARSKALLLALCAVLLVAVSVLETMAYLTSKTQVITNTFTVGDINIELTETKPESKQAKIIPGVDIEKDPKVTVKANSEACWLFVKIEERNWPVFKEAEGARKVSYAPADGWRELANTPGVYFRDVSAETAKAGVSYPVLAGSGKYPNGVVTVSENLTRAEINSIDAEARQPQLAITAYAVQHDGFSTAAAAWEKVNTTSGSN